MNTQTGELVAQEFVNGLEPEQRKQYVEVKRDLKLSERYHKQILLYAPCGCGSGKKFKFCCHTK